jgi:hypothetical protein
MGHLQRQVNAGARHHATQAPLPRAFLDLSAENSGNAKFFDFEIGARFVESGIV